MQSFPLNPIRKNIVNDWELLQIVENITVPLDNDHRLRLKEVPDNGEIKTAPIIPGYSRTTIFPPNPFQYYVNYRNGDVQFHPNQAGQNLTITYWGKGNLVEVYHVNYLYDMLTDHLNGHIAINDLGVSNEDVWSAEQIINYIRNNTETFKTDIFNLSATDISLRYVMLTEEPKNYQKVVVVIGNGIICKFNEDFVVDPLNHKFLRWDGFSLEGILEENDVMYVLYGK